ncbi:hypothetical protein DFP72DRAFT_855984 [Ephemerocybe angulata]|uniref:DUF6533 domain-containing protein n=1 Tax=Ephemerocybe angulata TaxID=980116 RepID=A0A8H6HFB8_9AGAR|nr:hypothetical protein DFP72DRAFT_855984 [Tulosesus angulatus]
MDLTPEKLAIVIKQTSIGITAHTDNISSTVAFYTFYIYHYFTTLDEEVSTMWPRKWRTGKILFLSARYIPMLVMADRILSICGHFPKGAVQIDTQGRRTFNPTPYRLFRFACEVALLLCLYALLGARRRYLVLLFSVYMREKALTLGTALVPISYIAEQVVAIFSLALFIFSVRYKNKGGSLIHIIRRDSGLYIFLLTALALGIAIVGTFRLQGFYNLQNPILDSIQRTVVPVLSCRLLLNMHLTEDPDLRTNVSTILFDFPSPGEDDDDDDSELRDTPVPMVHFKGLGRRRGGDEVSIPSTLAGSASNVVVESGQRV